MRATIFVLGMVAGAAVLGFAVFAYFRLGIAPVATAEPPMFFEHALAKAALHSRIRREMPASVPIEADEANLTAGAALYAKNCASCHGSPDKGSAPIAQGMFPDPPQLFVKMVTRDPEGEIYWKTKNGIRLTGMPSFRKSLSDTELWQVSVLLKHANALPQDVKDALNEEKSCGVVVKSTER